MLGAAAVRITGTVFGLHNFYKINVLILAVTSAVSVWQSSVSQV